MSFLLERDEAQSRQSHIARRRRRVISLFMFPLIIFCSTARRRRWNTRREWLNATRGSDVCCRGNEPPRTTSTAQKDDDVSVILLLWTGLFSISLSFVPVGASTSIPYRDLYSPPICCQWLCFLFFL